MSRYTSASKKVYLCIFPEGILSDIYTDWNTVRMMLNTYEGLTNYVSPVPALN